MKKAVLFSMFIQWAVQTQLAQATPLDPLMIQGSVDSDYPVEIQAWTHIRTQNPSQVCLVPRIQEDLTVLWEQRTKTLKAEVPVSEGEFAINQNFLPMLNWCDWRYSMSEFRIHLPDFNLVDGQKHWLQVNIVSSDREPDEVQNVELKILADGGYRATYSNSKLVVGPSGVVHINLVVTDLR